MQQAKKKVYILLIVNQASVITPPRFSLLLVLNIKTFHPTQAAVDTRGNLLFRLQNL